MLENIKSPLYRLLRWSEKYAKTDMVHFFSANFWLNFSRVISIGTGMILTVAFANLLDPATFGTYKYIIAAAGLVGTFSLNGLSTALMRAAAQGKKNIIPAIVWDATLWNIPASIVALGIGVYYFAHGNTDLAWGFIFIGVSNATGGIGVTKGVWQASGDFKIGTISGLPKIFISTIVILIAILLTKNVTWILVAYFGSNVILSIGGYYFMLWWYKVRSRDASKEEVAEAKKYGRQMTVIGFFQLASGQIDQLLLFHFVGPASLAVYALALSPINEVQNLLNNFLTVLFPKLAKKSEQEVHQMLPTRIKQMFFVSVIIAVFYVITVPFLFKYLFPKYLASVFVSQVLALTILLQFKGVIDTFFTAHGQIWNRSRMILISQAVEFGLFFGLIPFFGLWGAVSATVLSEAFAALIYLWIYYRARSSFQRAQSR